MTEEHFFAEMYLTALRIIGEGRTVYSDSQEGNETSSARKWRELCGNWIMLYPNSPRSRFLLSEFTQRMHEAGYLVFYELCNPVSYALKSPLLVIKQDKPSLMTALL